MSDLKPATAGPCAISSRKMYALHYRKYVVDYIWPVASAASEIIREVAAMSFHEKSAWACLVSIIVVYAPYLWMVLRYPMAALGLFIVAAVLLAALLTAFHIVNALATRSIRTTGDVPPVDELDRRIELVATKWAGMILALAVLTWVVAAMYLLPAIGEDLPAHANGNGPDLSSPNVVIPLLGAMAAAHWLFAGFVLANIVYYGSIVAGYRRLAVG